MCANVRSQHDFSRLAAFDSVAAEDGNLNHRMPGRGEGHHAFFDNERKIDDLHIAAVLSAGNVGTFRWLFAKCRGRTKLKLFRHQFANTRLLHFSIRGSRQLVNRNVAGRLLMLR